MRKPKESPALKQYQSCAKAMTVAILTVSGKIAIGEMKQEQLQENSERRFRGIQRKYGYNLFLECAPEVMQRMTEVPRVTMNFNGIKKQVFLQVKYLENYYKKLKGGD